jgi:hypothetical protein
VSCWLLDRRHRRRALGVQDRVYLLDDPGGLLGRLAAAQLQLDVDRAALARVDANPDLFDRRKALHRDLEFVHSGREIDEAVAAIVTRDDLLRTADELFAGSRDRDARQAILGAFDGHKAANAAA